jgi:bifunctional non-homologous end joining protein LigD
VTSSQEVTIRGKRLTLSNLGKVLYPKAGFTKAQVIGYYLRNVPG